MSPLDVVVRYDEPPPRMVTQPPADETLADSDCPARHARTTDRLPPGFTSPDIDDDVAPDLNFIRVVAGYELSCGGGVRSGVGGGGGVLFTVGVE